MLRAALAAVRGCGHLNMDDEGVAADDGKVAQLAGDGTIALIGEVFASGVDHAAVLVRHSAREFNRDIHDLLNPLTAEGRELCERFGARLDKTLTLRGYASPAQRCLETAELIMRAHRARDGGATRCRPVEGLGVFYVLDQMKMWQAMQQAGGMVGFLQVWFDGGAPDDAMMPAALAAKLVLRVMTGKLATPVAKPQLDLLVSHDITLHLLRNRLLGEPVDGPDIEFLDALIAYRRDQAWWLRSRHHPARRVSADF